MKIFKNIQKIPGGLMIVPLFLGVLMNTFIPQILQVGGLTTAMFSSAGTNTTIAITLFCVGAQIDFRQAGEVLKRGTVLMLSKFLAGAVLGVGIAHLCGMSGIMGISAIAIVAAVTNSNAGLYMSLTSIYGDEKDLGAQSVLSINDGPFLTMLVFGATGLADVPVMALLAAIGPVLVGMVLGNLDRDIAKFLQNGPTFMIPFFSFCLGAGISIKTLATGGLPGIMLGVLSAGVSGLFCILGDKFINRRPGYAGAAIASTAGNAAATPAMFAAAVPEMAPYVESATAQCACAVIVTLILIPLMTNWAVKKWGSAAEFEERKAAKTIGRAVEESA